jgi:2-polyprenyl-3-methyl-5-hydroxy-6-metoxy-1,4-benzoquinol methylase
MPRLTERDALIYGELWKDPPNFTPSDTMAAMVDDLLAACSGDGEPQPVLADLGCGGGRHALHAARCGMRVDAVDHNPAAVAALRERALSLPISVEQTDFVTWLEGRRAGTYDAVVCFDAIHHISPSQAVVEETIARLGALVRRDGFLLIALLADVAFSNDERPESRLEVSSDEAEEILDRATGALAPIKRKQRTIHRTVTSLDPTSGGLVTAEYTATRCLRLCRAK